MRRIATALTIAGTMLIGAGSAQAAVLTSANGVISYVADQGEKNDLLVSTDTILGGTVPVYSFKDLDANPIRIGGGPCQLINGVGMCVPIGVGSLAIDLRDRDDTGQIATVGAGGLAGPGIGALMIGGRGVDVLMGGNGGDILKGNDGRDSLRGRGGADTYKGGRGRDNLQTLDGIADTFISCGDGSGDVLRKDKIDPPGRHCEFSNHGNPSKPH
jgi:Ca2+-binding RTX toxin-like protein